MCEAAHRDHQTRELLRRMPQSLENRFQPIWWTRRAPPRRSTPRWRELFLFPQELQIVLQVPRVETIGARGPRSLEGRFCYSPNPRSTSVWISAATPPPMTTSSSPPSALIASKSFAASEWLIPTAVARPVTSTTPPFAATAMLSGPLVPLTVIVSAAPSPAAPPSTPARSMSALATAVPDRSLTTAVSAPPSAVRSTRSVVPTSMTMFPTLRVKRSRPATAEASKASLASEPLNSIVSMPAWPSTRSLASPGFQTRVSFPSPPNIESLACWPTIRSLPSPPVRTSASVPPLITSWISAARPGPAVIVSAPPRPLTVNLSFAASEWAIWTVTGAPLTSTTLSIAVIWMSSGLFVPLTVTESAAPSPPPPPIAASRSKATILRPVPVVSFTTASSLPPSACTSMNSVSFKSIVMLATSRRNRTRPPFAETSKFSAAPAPLKRSVSAPSCPSTTSLPSPGSQMNVSLPAPRSPVSAPPFPSITSSPSLPSSTSAPSPPLIVSFPAPPSIPSLIRAASPTEPEIVSLPPSPLTFRRSFAASECSIFTAAASLVTSTAPALGAIAIVSLPTVPLIVVVSTAPSVARSSTTSLTSVADRSFTIVLSMPPSALRSTRSTPAVSIVMAPWARKNLRRLPLAERSKFSAAAAPLKTIVSLPASPSTLSLPSPGSHVNESSPAPISATSAPPFPSIASLPSPPMRLSPPSPPLMASLPAPPSSVSWVSAASPSPALSVSFPASDSMASASALATSIGMPPGPPETAMWEAVADAATSIVSFPEVPSTVTRSLPAPGSRFSLSLAACARRMLTAVPMPSTELPPLTRSSFAADEPLMSTTSAAPSFARSALRWPSPTPARSLTTTLSAPPDGRRSNRSTLAIFIVLALRNLSRFPLAENSNVSAAFDPVKTTTSLPAPPSIRSLPRLPSIVSLPSPPNSRSAAVPPRSRSLPVSPKRLVASLPVNTP